MLGGILTSICTCSGHISASIISTPFLLHNVLSIFAISCFNCPYATFLRYFGANTTWYLHSHFVCDRLFMSIWTTSFALLGWRTEVIIALEVFCCKLKQLWSHLHSRWFIKRLPHKKVCCDSHSQHILNKLKIKKLFQIKHTILLQVLQMNQHFYILRS